MNRRSFLAYLTATSAACASCGSAVGSVFPGQRDVGSSSGSSPWPSSQPSPVTGPQPQPHRDDTPSESSTEIYGFEGCSLVFGRQGSIPRFGFLSSSGNQFIDRATVQEARNLAQITGFYPSFAFLDDRRSKNAFAINRDIITGRSPHGAVALGIMLIQDFLSLPAINPYENTLCIQAVMVHEWAHIAQFNLGVRASRVKYTELMADFMAGWFVGYKQFLVGQPVSLNQAMIGMYSIGDTNFNSQGHHGTPRERLSAYVEGYRFTTAGVSFGGSGALGGGSYRSGRPDPSSSYGRRSPPNFRTAFQHAASRYVK